jgi:hypothetical protein
MSPRELVETALCGGHGRQVPFTVYECMIPQCAAERELRNRGLCIVERRVNVFAVHRPNVRETRRTYWRRGKQFTRTVCETPAGNLTTLCEHAGFTQWWHERMFKSPDDYSAILSLIRDEQYEPNYAAFVEAEQRADGDAILRAGIGLEPLQALVSGTIMSMEDFCTQWMDNRDEVLKLYDALVENRRRVYPLVAESPALHANYGGNVVPEVTGPPVFEQYYVPHYNEAAEALHRRGKLLGCHFDANCRAIATLIAGTDLDYIEAFTPAPDTDMTLAEARRAWPGKVLWINFPSSLHLRPDREVEEAAVRLLGEAGSADGLIVGVTEDMPADRWRDSCRAIMDGLQRHAEQNSGLYA